MGRKGLLLFFGALVVIGGIFIYKIATRPSDAEQIRLALKESIQASKEGRPGSVVDLISDNFQINEGTTVAKGQIAKWIAQLKPDIEIVDPKPVISGDAAVITSPVHFRSALFGLERQMDSVKITLQRESAREWLIIPSTKWRITQVFVPPDVVTSFTSSLGAG